VDRCLGLVRTAPGESVAVGHLDFCAWTAAQRNGCDREIANLNSRVEKLVDITKLDTVFKKMREFFWAK
jgi:hypothetical protein